MAGFILSSSAFADGEYLALEQVVNEEVGFGCAGGNVSPQLSWTDPPAGTKSLALTMFDPDAPTGSGFWHWLALNLPADLRELPAGPEPPAAPCRTAASRRGTISASPATAARVRPRAIIRTATCSPSTR